MSRTGLHFGVPSIGLLCRETDRARRLWEIIFFFPTEHSLDPIYTYILTMWPCLRQRSGLGLERASSCNNSATNSPMWPRISYSLFSTSISCTGQQKRCFSAAFTNSDRKHHIQCSQFLTLPVAHLVTNQRFRDWRSPSPFTIISLSRLSLQKVCRLKHLSVIKVQVAEVTAPFVLLTSFQSVQFCMGI